MKKMIFKSQENRTAMRPGCFSYILLGITMIWAGNCAAAEGPGHICFRQIDSDHNGKVTFEEFAKHYGEDKKKFTLADVDGDGELTHDEYHDFLGHGAEDRP